MSGHDSMQREKELVGATAGRFVAAITVAAVLTLGQGCRTSDDDVHRWANSAQGPRKLVAVLTHDKYPIDLRIEAAETLVSMKPRGGGASASKARTSKRAWSMRSRKWRPRRAPP